MYVCILWAPEKMVGNTVKGDTLVEELFRM